MASNTHPGTALITGASSGIGAIYADRLARRGYDLILVARSQERLDGIARAIGEQTGRSVRTVAADLNGREGLARTEAILREDGGITLLVNNAGLGAASPLLETDIEQMEALIGLNVTALTRLAYAAAPGFVARGAGAIINIASSVGIAPEMLNGVYGGSKAYVIAFSQSLAHELGGKGVRIQAVLPGATATPFWAAAGVPIEHLPKEIVMPADAMVDAALAGFDQGELITIPSLADAGLWHAYEAARQALRPNLSLATPAPRLMAA